MPMDAVRSSAFLTARSNPSPKCLPSRDRAKPVNGRSAAARTTDQPERQGRNILPLPGQPSRPAESSLLVRPHPRVAGGHPSDSFSDHTVAVPRRTEWKFPNVCLNKHRPNAVSWVCLSKKYQKIICQSLFPRHFLAWRYSPTTSLPLINPPLKKRKL